MLKIQVGPIPFSARLEVDAAPKTCTAIRALLPVHGKIVQARWSGEAAWVPLGDLQIGVTFENHTSHPAPGELLLYPGGYSETEILFPYGGTMFRSQMGQLAGNHFATVVDGVERLAEVGRLVLWEGAQDFTMDLA